MNDDRDIGRGHVEEPMRLDDLESLVHQRRRIDRDLAAHLPGRMPQRVGGRDAGERRTVERPERTARRRENQATHFVAAARVQTLVNRVVLAVDGQNRHAPPPGGVNHERAGHDEDFLVGECQRLPRFDRGKRRLETGSPGRRREHDIHVRMSGRFHETGAPGRQNLRPLRRQAGAEDRRPPPRWPHSRPAGTRAGPARRGAPCSCRPRAPRRSADPGAPRRRRGRSARSIPWIRESRRASCRPHERAHLAPRHDRYLSTR